MFGKKPAQFPVQRSVLSAAALLAEAIKRYPINPAATCEFIKQGMNDHYLITGPGQRFVLRVYRAGWRSEPEILWEVGLLEHLKDAGAPVAAAVKTLAGHWFCLLQAPEGMRYAVLFEAAEGREQTHAALTPKHAQDYGRGLATIHEAASSYVRPHPRGDLNLFSLLHAPLQALAPRLTHRPDDLAYVRALADRLRDAIVEMENRGLSQCVCHGDAHGGNAHLDGRGEFTFFDFDFAGPGWRAYDLATYRWGLQHGRLDPRSESLWHALLDGYRQVRDLTHLDEVATMTFVAAREIWLLGLCAATGDDIGFYHLHDAYLDERIQFLKDWEARYLVTN